MTKKPSKPIEVVKPIDPVAEPIINISMADFLSSMDMPDSMKTLFADFYKKVGVNWISRDQWMSQWKKFKKLSPVATDRARRKGMML